MKLSKYAHACFTAEKDGHTLVIDPGNLSTDFVASSGVAAVVITHEHADHFDHDHLSAILAHSTEAVIVAHPAVTAQLGSFTTRAVLPGDRVAVGPFELVFFGGEHAVIHPDIPSVVNLGVLIDELVYYPGDSLVRPDVVVDTLALPVSAPWLKVSEVIDFVRDVRPRLAFPTHDAILSDAGKAIVDRVISSQLNDGTIYQRIEEIQL